MHTIMCHSQSSEHPLTHLALFDTGGLLPEHSREEHEKFYNMARRFAVEQGSETTSVETKLEETSSNAELRVEVYSICSLARALALQGLFLIYLLSSGYDISKSEFRSSAYYEHLLVLCVSMESLAFTLQAWR